MPDLLCDRTSIERSGTRADTDNTGGLGKLLHVRASRVIQEFVVEIVATFLRIQESQCRIRMLAYDVMMMMRCMLRLPLGIYIWT